MIFYANSPEDRVLTPLHRSLFTFYYKLYIEHINQYPDKDERCRQGLNFQGGNIYGYLFCDNTETGRLNVLLSIKTMRWKPDKNVYPKITYLFHKTLNHTKYSGSYLRLKPMYPKLGLLRVCFHGLR